MIWTCYEMILVLPTPAILRVFGRTRPFECLKVLYLSVFTPLVALVDVDSRTISSI